MILWLILLAAAAVAGLLLLSAYYSWEWVEGLSFRHLSRLWAFWTVKLQSLAMLVSGSLAFDPGAVLYAVNLIPGHSRAMLPAPVAHALSVLGIVLFVLQAASIIARGVKQRKVREKHGVV